MDTTWVVVADSARARFFSRKADKHLVEFETMISPDQRLHESELVSDRQGRIQTSASGRHGIGQTNTLKEHEKDLFADHIASRLEEGRSSNQLNSIVLVAAPESLGRIRSKLSAPCEKIVAYTLDKDLTRLLPEQLAEHVPGHL